MSTLINVTDLCKYFPQQRNFLGKPLSWKKAVDKVSFTVERGKTYSLVGESGCGKTTTGRCLLRLIEPTSGKIIVDDADVASLSTKQLMRWRRKMQIIFQDPYSSLNSRLTVGQIVSEGWEIHNLYPQNERAERLAELFKSVGLLPEYIGRYAHEFSGGQRQRIGIARALALSPEFIVCDEAVSALDVSIQAQIINLLVELQAQHNIAYLFISHGLAVVRHISHRVGVMYAGKLVEEADVDDLFNSPQHPYTQMLLSAIPEIDPQHRRPHNVAISEAAPPISGCAFANRCPHAKPECHHEEPIMKNIGSNRLCKCWLNK